MKPLVFVVALSMPLWSLPTSALAQARSPAPTATVQGPVIWTDAQGQRLAAVQTLIRRSDGSLLYRYADQSPAAKRYHQHLCKLSGGAPSHADAVVGSIDAIGSVGCAMPARAPARGGAIVDGVFLPNPNPPAEASGGAAKAGTSRPDFVYAHAPIGAAPAGQNFPAVGGGGYYSQAGGTGSLKVSLDNDRCTLEQNQAVAPNEDTAATLTVVCIESAVRTLPTYTRACLNGTCVTEHGSIDVVDISR